MIKESLNYFQKFLEKIDHYRDSLLFLFIKPYWPRKITPNHITWIRVAISIILLVALFIFGVENKIFVISLFCIGVATDMLDGSVARGLNMVTEFGAMLDATADRILILPIAVYSLLAEQKILLLALVLGEIANAIASTFYQSKEIYLESNIFGKTKMVLQSIVFIVILIVWPYSPSGFFINLLWISLIFTILSIFSRVMELKTKGLVKNKIFTKNYTIKK